MKIKKVDGHYLVSYGEWFGPLLPIQEIERIFNSLPDLLEFIRRHYE